jgi:hypothetical protein
MRIIKLLFLVLLSIGAAGCAARIPLDKWRYVGDWQGETARLLITRDGHVHFEQYKVVLKGNMTIGMEGPLKRFDGDNFIVGFGPVSTTFVVEKPPYKDGDEWKMTVGKHELTRMSPMELP